MIVLLCEEILEKLLGHTRRKLLGHTRREYSIRTGGACPKIAGVKRKGLTISLFPNNAERQAGLDIGWPFGVVSFLSVFLSAACSLLPAARFTLPPFV
jgi:hypothetical protein